MSQTQPAFVRSEPSAFSKQIHAANLTFEDVVRLTDGRISLAKIKNHSVGKTPLSPEDAAIINQVIAAWRMAQAQVKFVVFQAIQGVKAAR
jgi:hypothetical protein